jgi:uncharacterized DUF497 family protein
MKKTRFEWDEEKDDENQTKHGVSFGLAQRAFLILIVLLQKMSAIVPVKSDSTVWAELTMRS